MTANPTRSANPHPEEPPLLRVQMDAQDADYFDFPANDGTLAARLVVLLDAHGRAQSAELRYYQPLPPQAQDAIRRRSANQLAQQYVGVESSTPLYEQDGSVQQAPTPVVHSLSAAPPAEQSYQLWPVILAIVGLFALVALVWAFLTWMRGDWPGDGTVDNTAAIATAVAATAAAQPAAAPAAALGQAAAPAVAGSQTNNLPPSRMADGSLTVGARVQIRPQLQSFVRTMPGPDQGEPVGYLQDGATATIVGGPVWLAGESDTIVWWYVELANGTRGWTPANTSSLTLLDPAP